LSRQGDGAVGRAEIDRQAALADPGLDVALRLAQGLERDREVHLDMAVGRAGPRVGVEGLGGKRGHGDGAVGRAGLQPALDGDALKADVSVGRARRRCGPRTG
ncbi:MAG: hypothetical protein MZV64_18425, partial [Ignavibacteriales bacterium]|nr:hypothetical protein [Ignavibacteriales bacterium]